MDRKTIEQLDDNNKLQEKIANELWKWFRSGKKIDGMHGPCTAYTSGFRPTDYNNDFEDDTVINAIKSFTRNVNTTTETMESLIRQLQIVRKKGLSTPDDWHIVREDSLLLLYFAPDRAFECHKHKKEEALAEARIGTLLSGVGQEASHIPKVICKKPPEESHYAGS